MGLFRFLFFFFFNVSFPRQENDLTTIQLFNSKLDKRYAECWLRSFNDSFVFNCACAVQRKDGRQIKVVIKRSIVRSENISPSPSILFFPRKFMSPFFYDLSYWNKHDNTSTFQLLPISLRILIKNKEAGTRKKIYSYELLQQFSNIHSHTLNHLYLIILIKIWKYQDFILEIVESFKIGGNIICKKRLISFSFGF